MEKLRQSVGRLFFAGKPYRAMVQKIYREMLGVMAKSFLIIMAIRVLGYQKIGNFLAELIVWIKGCSWTEAQSLYFTYIRSNIEYLMFYAFLVFFIIFMRMLILRFTRYFDEIIAGVDQLVKGDQPIILSPELDFMQIRLTQVRQQLQAAAAAEREAEKKKNDFLLYLAHDIRTPLTSVIGYLSLLEKFSGLDVVTAKKYLAIAMDKALKLQKLIEEFFDVTRLTFQQVKLNLQPVDVGCMLVQLADEAFPVAASAGMTIQLSGQSDPIMVNADPDKLARALQNLMRNAVSYGEKGQISISSKVLDNQCAISFSNPGQVAQQELDRFFERFYRGDPSRGSASNGNNTGGAGLGLVIARDIIRLHGGSLSASCQGGQITFRVLLPILGEGQPEKQSE